jgi:hypothetical protein
MLRGAAGEIPLSERGEARVGMPEEEVIELRLDVARVDLRAFGAVTQRVASLGVSISTLAEQHALDPEALARLYALGTRGPWE